MKRGHHHRRSPHASSRQQRHWAAHFAHGGLVARGLKEKCGSALQRKIVEQWYEDVFGVPLAMVIGWLLCIV